MAKSFKPMFDKILVRKIPPGESNGGIALPVHVTTLEMMERGEVISVGPGRRTDEGKIVPLILMKGDKVMFLKGAGYRLDEDHIVMHEADVMGMV